MNIKKREKYKRLIMGLISSVLIIFLLGSYACAWLTHYNLVLNSDRIQADHFGWKGNLLIFGVYVVLIFLFSRIYNGFRIGLLSVGHHLFPVLVRAVHQRHNICADMSFGAFCCRCAAYALGHSC